MRVSASGPNSSRPGPADFQVPRPRLQFTRALTAPSVPNSIEYFDLSSGVSVLSSPPWNFTICQAVPASVSGACALAADAASVTSSAITIVENFARDSVALEGIQEGQCAASS